MKRVIFMMKIRQIKPYILILICSGENGRNMNQKQIRSIF